MAVAGGRLLTLIVNMLLLLIIACFIIVRGAPSFAAPYVFARCSMLVASTIDTLLYPEHAPFLHGPARGVKSPMGEAQKTQKDIVCFEFRDTIKTEARTEYILLSLANGQWRRIKPRWEQRSRTGAHGEDCYLAGDIKKAHAIVNVQISNSGRHYCSLRLNRKLSREELLKLAVWLYNNEHICRDLARDLIKAGLPADVLADLLQRDP